MNKLTGFVIKKIDYGAKDEIISIFSKREVISLIALGTRKMQSKNRVAIQIGNLVEIEYFRARLSNRLSKLKKASLIVQPPLRTFNTAETILEIYKYLSQLKSESPTLFRTLIDVYSHFGIDCNSHIKTFVMFAFLDALGHYPQNGGCIDCGRHDRINGFEFHKGGFTCVDHSARVRKIAELKAIQMLFGTFGEYAKTSSVLNQGLHRQLEQYISESFYL